MAAYGAVDNDGRGVPAPSSSSSHGGRAVWKLAALTIGLTVSAVAVWRGSQPTPRAGAALAQRATAGHGAHGTSRSSRSHSHHGSRGSSSDDDGDAAASSSSDGTTTATTTSGDDDSSAALSSVRVDHLSHTCSHEIATGCTLQLNLSGLVYTAETTTAAADDGGAPSAAGDDDSAARYEYEVFVAHHPLPVTDETSKVYAARPGGAYTERARVVSYDQRESIVQCCHSLVARLTPKNED